MRENDFNNYSKKSGRTRKFRISDMGIRHRFFLPVFITAISALVTAGVMIWSLYGLSAVYKDSAEENIITSSEQIISMAVDSGVSVARNIYSNEILYKFLDGNYGSPSEYYDAYSKIQESSPNLMSESNAVKNFKIYTENPSVISGGVINSLSETAEEDWLLNYKKTGKPISMYCDSVTDSLYITRELDFINLKNGKAYVRVEMDTDIIDNALDNLNFNGDFYIVNGGTVLYGNSHEQDDEQIAVTQDFKGYTRNFYSADLEFYAKSSKVKLSFVRKILLLVSVVILLSGAVCARVLCADILKRVRIARLEFENSGNLMNLDTSRTGLDEIGSLINMGVKISEKLSSTSLQNEMSNEDLFRKNEGYRKLFEMAVRQDADIAMHEKYLEISPHKYVDRIPFGEELKLMKGVCEKCVPGCVFSMGDGIPQDVPVPAYCLALLADDICESCETSEIEIRQCEDGRTEMSFRNKKPLSQAKELKLLAIFEDSNVAEEYGFYHAGMYNVYLRFKFCFGDSGDIAIQNKDNYEIKFYIDFDKYN